MISPSRPTDISVIIPNLDMARFLPDAIGSITRQSLPVAEILLVDRFSRDGSADLARRLAADGVPLRLIEHDAPTPAAARNIGLREAKTALIAFLDADDLFPADKLARQIARLHAEPHLGMVSGFITYFDKLDPVLLAPAPDSRLETLFHVHLGACLYRREVLERLGGFAGDLTYSEDVDLLLRVREQAIPFTILRSVMLYYRRHPDSMMMRPDPRREGDFRRAVGMSLVRRRARGITGDLPAFESYFEPAA